MKFAFSFLGFALFTSLSHAEAVYTCTNAKGDSVIVEFTQDWQRMSLRSLYAEVKFAQSKRHANDPAYANFRGRYPTGEGFAVATVAVQSSLLQENRVTNDIVGSIKFDHEAYGCQVGAGKLKVSRATRREFSRGQSGEPCKLTTYYNGMTFIPPRVVCNYGNGIISITGGGRRF